MSDIYYVLYGKFRFLNETLLPKTVDEIKSAFLQAFIDCHRVIKIVPTEYPHLVDSDFGKAFHQARKDMFLFAELQNDYVKQDPLTPHPSMARMRAQEATQFLIDDSELQNTSCPFFYTRTREIPVFNGVWMVSGQEFFEIFGRENNRIISLSYLLEKEARVGIKPAYPPGMSAAMIRHAESLKTKHRGIDDEIEDDYFPFREQGISDFFRKLKQILSYTNSDAELALGYAKAVATEPTTEPTANANGQRDESVGNAVAAAKNDTVSKKSKWLSQEKILEIIGDHLDEIPVSGQADDGFWVSSSDLAKQLVGDNSREVKKVKNNLATERSKGQKFEYQNYTVGQDRSGRIWAKQNKNTAKAYYQREVKNDK